MIFFIAMVVEGCNNGIIMRMNNKTGNSETTRSKEENTSNKYNLLPVCASSSLKKYDTI
ncbi:hypothetical protein [Candidatus Cardinium hertigii]|uniref:hypothetical protein n=1 Tax=Candidatus Cardinium hertigii TaxID=247481 RepID=UPI00194F6E11|nr:hypothetical protein [Candidatus Cardinium hertigii]